MIITNAKYTKDTITDLNNGVNATIDNVVMSVPMDTGNRHYAEILKQVADGNLTIAPEYTDAEIAANAQELTNATSRAYLASTDWYATRKYETGVAIPADVTTAREAARSAIV